MNTRYHAAQLWDGQGWHQDVLICVDETGHITRLQPGASSDGAEHLAGPVIPALVNGHSHAFQRAMVGWAERRVGSDDFWRWRELMYGLAGRLLPEQLRTIAEQLFIEMLKAGYTQVCEFHYLHKDVDGNAYEDLALTSKVLLAAANTVGIGMTLLPVLYQHRGFDQNQPTPMQRRFALGDDQFLTLCDKLSGSLTPLDRLGSAFHSLRAVRSETISRLLTDLPVGPHHIHVSEQLAEVEDCRACVGQTPIQHLAENLPLDSSWFLVHATHATSDELAQICTANATVVLCPGTEANLGDGLFSVESFLDQGGHFAIGSDSQVTVSPADELRLLEYGQRLTRRQRNVLCEDSGSTGHRLWAMATAGGSLAGDVKVGRLQAGWRADWLVLDQHAPQLAGMAGDSLLDGFIFGNGCSTQLIRAVYVAGKAVIVDGQHPQQQSIAAKFNSAMRKLHCQN